MSGQELLQWKKLLFLAPTSSDVIISHRCPVALNSFISTHSMGSASFLSSFSPPWFLTCWVSWLSTLLAEFHSLFDWCRSTILLNLSSGFNPWLSLLFHPTPLSSLNYRDNIKYSRLSVSSLPYFTNSSIFFPLSNYSHGHTIKLITNCNTNKI